MALGLLWSIINPLVMLVVLTFIFTYVYPSQSQRVFPVFVLLGLVVFNLFSRTVITATVSVQENASLIKKVAFPRQLIPFSVIVSQMLDGIVMVVLLMAFVLFFRVPVTPHFLWLAPVYAVEFVFIVGVSLITSSLNVYFRDMRYLVESAMTILFWLTPVFYPLELIRKNLSPLVYHIYLLNPLAGCVDASRRAVLEATAPDAMVFGVAAGVTAVTAVSGLLLFNVLQRRFADFT
jgi:ABC-type polysaccharide/polyol phosphate export permease